MPRDLRYLVGSERKMSGLWLDAEMKFIPEEFRDEQVDFRGTSRD